MLYEWDPAKAAANLEKHGVSFAEASTIFLDPLAATWPDPDHSISEHRFITLGLSADSQLLFVAHQEIADERLRIINARRRPDEDAMPTKKASRPKPDELRPEYDVSALGPAVRGKYYERASAGTNVVLLDPDVARAFPTGEAVNTALRMLVDVASVVSSRKTSSDRKR